MDKKVLLEYIDACELLKETEAELESLHQHGGKCVQDSVRGSMQDFPYAPKIIHIEGVLDSMVYQGHIKSMERILLDRAAAVAAQKEQVEQFLNELAITSPRILRIYKCKYIEGMSWEQIAGKFGRGSTGESLRKEWERFIHTR